MQRHLRPDLQRGHLWRYLQRPDVRDLLRSHLRSGHLRRHVHRHLRRDLRWGDLRRHLLPGHLRRHLRRDLRRDLRRGDVRPHLFPGDLQRDLLPDVRTDLRADAAGDTLLHLSVLSPEPVDLGWTPRLGGDQQQRALEAARLIAARVTEPTAVAASLRLAHRQTSFPMSIHWNPLAIAQGDAGQALLASHLDRVFPDEGWDAGCPRSALPGHPVLPPPACQPAGADQRARRPRVHDPAPRRRPPLPARAQRPGWCDRPGQPVRGRGAPRPVRRHGLQLRPDLRAEWAVLALLPADGRRASPALPFLVRALCELALAGDDLPAWHTPAACSTTTTSAGCTRTAT